MPQPSLLCCWQIHLICNQDLTNIFWHGLNFPLANFPPPRPAGLLHPNVFHELFYLTLPVLLKVDPSLPEWDWFTLPLTLCKKWPLRWSRPPGPRSPRLFLRCSRQNKREERHLELETHKHTRLVKGFIDPNCNSWHCSVFNPFITLIV